MIGIYKFTNKYNQKIYIGQSINIEARYKAHIRDANKGAQTHFYRALRKYGIDSFYFDVLIECPKENLDYWEKFYIKYYCSNNPNYGYNMTKGGDGMKNPSQDIRKKMRAAKLGKHPSEEAIKHMSESRKGHPNYREGLPSPFKGKHHTKESKQKLKEANLGKKYSNDINKKKGKSHITSDETRKKISEIHKINGYKPCEYCLKRASEVNKGRTPPNKGKHKVWDEINNKFHYE